MIKELESILLALLPPQQVDGAFSILGPTEQFDLERTDKAGVAQGLNASFLVTLAGTGHPAYNRARNFLTRMADSSEWAEIAKFYETGIRVTQQEIETVAERNTEFAKDLTSLREWVSGKENLKNPESTLEKIWSVFCPEAVGIRGHEQDRVETLRARRTVTLTERARAFITDPAGEMLLTSNALLAPPPASESVTGLPLSSELKQTLSSVVREPQLYWYDHPIQVGVDPDRNEILYGLRELEAALEFERERGTMPKGTKVPLVLSVSVTHKGLQGIAKRYIEEQFARSDSLKNIQPYVCTEADTQLVIGEILAPAAEHYLQRTDARETLSVFGVDGEYGRHYSFLKAIAAFWKVFLQPRIKATFKIDLDQVFPQEALVAQTGASALEHFTSALWGAQGLASDGQPVELGLIAGALVNVHDISKSLFTPDVPFPDGPLSPDEWIFFSRLPQALSTEAEMMARYNTDKLNSRTKCIQRVHVTGGTTGILVDSLRRHRPFTPSFIGRAEDQAYILSVFSAPNSTLAYVHNDGLIMRHDKEAFAQESIHAAEVGKLVADYVRILNFSAYADVLTDDVAKLKVTLDPFTGCFISRIPRTVVYLRLALKAQSLFAAGKEEQGLELVSIGARRIMKALDFTEGVNSPLKQQYERERLGWAVYYDVLSSVEDALKNQDGFALGLRKKAEKLIDQCAIHFSH